MSPSARKNMSRVWLRMAGTSEATKYSPSPRPMTTGGPSRAATILFGIAAAEDGQREDAADLLHRAADRLFQIAVEVLLDQVGDDFGVGFGLEDVAFAAAVALSAADSFRRCRCAPRRCRRCSRGADGRFLRWGGRGWPSGCGRCRSCHRRDRAAERLPDCEVCPEARRTPSVSSSQ